VWVTTFGTWTTSSLLRKVSARFGRSQSHFKQPERQFLEQQCSTRTALFPMGGGIFQLYMGQALKMDDTQKRKPKLTEKMMITLILVVLCFFQTNPNITCCCFFCHCIPSAHCLNPMVISQLSHRKSRLYPCLWLVYGWFLYHCW
jgi:hypothetical protein